MSRRENTGTCFVRNKPINKVQISLRTRAFVSASIILFFPHSHFVGDLVFAFLCPSLSILFIFLFLCQNDHVNLIRHGSRKGGFYIVLPLQNPYQDGSDKVLPLQNPYSGKSSGSWLPAPPLLLRACNICPNLKRATDTLL